ncbi:transient receptor potential cation channel subfamily M member 2-like [Monodelphis domestica]|uniref:transient receptor potential cation channel subfamily M member 2-like n=1 Tax=Monodelphis domestica TaxID=13616 RepID=UPI0024E27656|nr:transient receptor potential cation channel subfamily M member 2-like [Monodelphis domestica]
MESRGPSRPSQGDGHGPSVSLRSAPLRENTLQLVSCLARFRAFFTAPVVIFHLNILSYFTFLWLFAYVLMVDFQPLPSWRELVIYFWLFSLVCEETRQVPDYCSGS